MLPLILFIPFLFTAFLTFDQIVKTEHGEFFGNWVDDGQPRGFLWKPPPGPSWLGTGWAGQSRWFVWLFQTPPWAKSSTKVMGLLRCYRVCVLIWNLGIILWFAIAWLIRGAGGTS